MSEKTKCEYCNSKLVVNQPRFKPSKDKELIIQHEKDCPYIQKIINGEIGNE